MNTPLVSISCITYNHAPYIRQCLNGFLMQECDFDFEVLIHDDASTDGTSEIIREYQEKYPNIIKPIIQTENQWSKGVRGINIKFNFSRAKGKYIAMCEGDDYWTDPLKLQKQVDFLEENAEYGLIGGSANRIYDYEDFKILHKPAVVPKTNFDFDTRYLISKNPLSTLTVCFRADLINKFPENYYKKITKDRDLYILLSIYKKFRFTKEVFGVYRIHSQGVSAKFRGNYLNSIEGLKESLRTAEVWNKHFNNEYESEVKEVKHDRSLKIIKYYLMNNKWKSATGFIDNIILNRVNFKMKAVIILLKIYKRTF